MCFCVHLRVKNIEYFPIFIDDVCYSSRKYTKEICWYLKGMKCISYAKCNNVRFYKTKNPTRTSYRILKLSVDSDYSPTTSNLNVGFTPLCKFASAS